MNIKISKSDLIFVIFGFIATIFSIIFFTFIYEQLFTLIFILVYFIFYSFLKFKKLIINNRFLISILTFITIFLYLLFNKSDYLILDNTYINTFSPAYIFNILNSLLFIFFIFFTGYFYSLQNDQPLRIFSKILIIQISVFIFYLIVKSISSSEDLDFNLGVGILIVTSAPYFLISFKLNNLKKNLIILLILCFLCVYFSMRGSLIAMIMFLITYYSYSYLIKNKLIFKIYFIINILIIFLLFYLYLNFYDDEILNDLNIKYFNKSFDSGRATIWIELLMILENNLVFGLGNDQSSLFMQGEFTKKIRSLSSHSLYFELLLAGGVVLLFLIIFLFYMIWSQLFEKKNLFWGQIGSSSLISMLYLSSTSANLINGNIVYNSLFWIIIGVSLAQVVKKNKSIEYEK